MFALRILTPQHLLAPSLLHESLPSLFGSEISGEVYGENEESAKMLSSRAADLAAIPDTLIFPLRETNQLLPLAAALPSPLPAEPQFLHHYFDPANQFSWPFGFTLLAIAGPGTPVEVPSHWKDLAGGRIPFRSPPSPIYARFLFAALEHGFPPSPGSLARQAGPVVPRREENARIEVDFSQRLQLRNATPGWTIHIPPEGSWIRLFHWVIPRSCANPKAAGTALQVLYRPEVLGRIASEALLAVTARDARRAVPAELLRNPNIYPSESLLDRSVFARVDWLAPSPTAG
ncbi:hypothetical protein MAMC_00392 [Methylacidimicrobium cyclopophantes]|uniref:Uncharacterized protein n=2 Tax=Methylacidimicrobium cyclopophantes TaxID=1041766 RepID=A0A5E6MHV6_9BACT|nr:hypothetical protein MAMC_00392 [Methylacidimicrobium cyclopophantes]